MRGKIEIRKMLFRATLILALLLVSSVVVNAATLLPDATNKAYVVSNTNDTSPFNATTEFSSAQYAGINTSNTVYTTSTAQETITATCTATGTATCTDNGMGGYCESNYDCMPTGTGCTKACPTITNAISSGTAGCTYSYSYCQRCLVIIKTEHICRDSYTCSTTGSGGSCNYTCSSSPQYYDINGLDSDGCESTTPSYKYTFQRYTFNVSAYNWNDVTELKFCWEGKYNSTGGAYSSNLLWYDVSSSSWTLAQSLSYDSGNTYCITFNSVTKTSVYNSTDKSVQFAVRVNESKTGQIATLFADFAYLNLTSVPDTIPPTYYPATVGKNSTNPARLDDVKFYSQWYDNDALGQYTFSWTGGGPNCDTWTSDAPTAFQTANWTNTTKTIPRDCIGKTISWQFNATDAANNNASTPVDTFIVQTPLLCTNCFVTAANITITNANGTFVADAPMTCSFFDYIPGTTDSRCGFNASSTANMSNFSCSYPFTKNYTVEGDWNITVQFRHDSGYNPYDPAIKPGQNGSDCTGPSTCRTDPECRVNEGEKLTSTLYTINWDAKQEDCEGLNNGSVWYSQVTAGTNGKCCGDDGAGDDFYYQANPSADCMYCYHGENNTAKIADRLCPEANCLGGGWNSTPCANLTQYAIPAPTGHTCFGTPIRLICNYTNGDYSAQILPGDGTQVNITIDHDGTVAIHQFNGPGWPGISDVYFDEVNEVYYYETTELEVGNNKWNCSAVATGYRYQNTTSQDYDILTPDSVFINYNILPPETQGAQYSTPVNFTAEYRNATDSSLIRDATCGVNISGVMHPMFMNEELDPDAYQVITDQLYIGPNSIEFKCNKSCFEVGRNFTTYPVSFGGELHPPVLTFEDAVYSINSSEFFHKVVKKTPTNDTFVKIFTESPMVGSNWTYGMVVKPAVEKPTCNQLPEAGRDRILLVRNASLISNISLCPQLCNFGGLIFDDGSTCTGANHTDCVDKLAANCPSPGQGVAYLLNFWPSIYYTISDATYVLLNGDFYRVVDISKLREFYLNGYYKESKFAPSFLMRLRGDFNPSPFGIESFVKIDQFPFPKSAVDYYYFNTTYSPPIYKIQGMPNCENISICNSPVPHFYMDNEIAVVNSSGAYTHLQIYGLDLLTLPP